MLALPPAVAAAPALAAVGAAAGVLQLALRRSQLARRHSTALIMAARLACGMAILLVQLEPPPAGNGALAVATTTVLHPEVGGQGRRVWRRFADLLTASTQASSNMGPQQAARHRA